MATPVAVGGRHRQSRCCEFVTSRGSELDKGGVTDARAIAWLACSAGPNVGRDVSVIWPNERSGATERATAKSAQPNGAKLLLPYAGGAGRLVICSCGTRSLCRSRGKVNIVVGKNKIS